MIYLDNSATSYPKPLMVRQAVSKGLVETGANPGRGGYAMATKTDETVYSVRKKVSAFFNAPGADHVVFCQSCTAAINQVLFGFLKAGDHVIISDLEHNAVLRPVYELSKRGVEYSVAKTYPGDNNATVASFRNLLKENTKLIVTTGASNVWGIRLPIDRIAALAHIYDVKLCVDAAQLAGIAPIDMEESGIDFLCLPAHKGLYGLMGLGVMVIRNTEELIPLIYGGTGVNSKSFTQPEEGPERYESGTVNVPGIISLGAGIDFVNKIGIDVIRNEEMAKVKYIYIKLTEMKGIRLYTPEPSDPYFVPLISFTATSESEEIAEKLGSKGIAVRAGLHCSPLAHEKFSTMNGTVRVSPSYFTNNKEVDMFIRELNNIL